MGFVKTSARKDRELFTVKKTNVDTSKKKKLKKKKAQVRYESEEEHAAETPLSHPAMRNLRSVTPLSIESMQIGQLILGCVCEVQDYQLMVSLPHKLVGVVPLTLISPHYTQQLQQVSTGAADDSNVHTLAELFSPGQFFSVAVHSKPQDGKSMLQLSLMAADVNSQVSSEQLQRGSLLQCTVHSIEDNGTILDTGVVGVRSAFLPSSATERAGVLGVGSVVQCVVTAIKGVAGEVSLTLSSKLAARKQALEKASGESLLLPGCVVNGLVEKVTTDGLLVAVGDGLAGVVSPHHLRGPFDKPSLFREGQKLVGRLLYATQFPHRLHITINSVVCSIQTPSDPLHGFEIGAKLATNVKVVKSSPSGVKFNMDGKAVGFCPAHHLANSPLSAKAIQKKFSIGSEHTCKIIAFNYIDQVFILSLRGSDAREVAKSDMRVGDIYPVKIHRYDDKGAVVKLTSGIEGYVFNFHLTDNKMTNPQQKHPVGKLVNARLLEKKTYRDQCSLRFTLKSDIVNSTLPVICSIEEGKIGSVTEGCVINVSPKGVLVMFYDGITGYLRRYDAMVPAKEDIYEAYIRGQVVKVKVTGIDAERNKYLLTCRMDADEQTGHKHTRLTKEEREELKKRKRKEKKELKAAKRAKLQEESNVKEQNNSESNTIKKKKSVQAEPKEKQSTVETKNVETNSEKEADEAAAEPESNTEDISSSCGEERECEEIHELSVEEEVESDEENDCDEMQEVSGIEENDQLDEKSDESSNVEESIDGDSEMCKVRINEDDQEGVEQMSEGEEENDDEAESMPGECDGEVNESEDTDESQTESSEVNGSSEQRQSIRLRQSQKNKGLKSSSSDVQSSIFQRGQNSGHQCLEIKSGNTGFVWSVPTSEAAENLTSSDSEEEKDNQIIVRDKKKHKRLSQAEKEAAEKDLEQRLWAAEQARLDKSRQPETALDYEEMLQASPNSSAVWIQYVSFYLESAEIEKAKAVARRALDKIDFREEGERLNVWTVLLRLEVLYGSPESIKAAFSEALMTNDQLKAYTVMAMVYTETDKPQEAEDTYKAMLKKFGSVKEVWIKAGVFYFKQSRLTNARTLMDRALLSLDKRDHVFLINRFAQLEFQFGEVERGRTMFESLVSNYPKRLDLWSVYVNILTKHGDVEAARHVLERMAGLKLRVTKMRTVFKHLLNFETAHGNSQRVEAVKRRVQEYVENALHPQTTA